AETGSDVYSTTTPDPVASIAFAEDGRSLAVGMRDRIQIVDMLRKSVRTISLELDRAEAEPGQGYFLRIAFSADGRYLSESSIGPIRIFDVTDGRLVRSLADPPLVPANNAILTTGGRLLMAHTHATRIVVTELSPGVSTRVLKSPAVPQGRAVFSADGGRLATRMSDASLRVWRLDTQAIECRAPWSAPGRALDDYEDLALSADGSIVVQVTGRRPNGEQGVQVWDVHACKMLASLEHNAQPPPARFPLLAGGQEEQIRSLSYVHRIAISPS